jgi:hypothetical protein
MNGNRLSKPAERNWRKWVWLIGLGILWIVSLYLTSGDAYPVGIGMFAFGWWISSESERAKVRQRSGRPYFLECAEVVRRYHGQVCETRQTCQCAALASALEQRAEVTWGWFPYRWFSPEEWT